MYFAHLVNKNKSIHHTGDEQTGDGDIGGSGDDEIVTVHLKKVPSRVKALVVLAQVATEDRWFNEVKTCRLRLVDMMTGGWANELC